MPSPDETPRPLNRFGIDVLMKYFEDYRGSTERLLVLRHELTYRNTRMAIALRAKVEEVLGLSKETLPATTVPGQNKSRPAPQPGEPAPRFAKLPKPDPWPKWDRPSSEEILAMAHGTVPFIRFLNPDVVQRVVEDNTLQRAVWIKSLRGRKINPDAYLWDQSPCAFPGVRRYAGSKEIAAFRGHTRLAENRSVNALALDDNDYPKQLWSFVLCGVKFRKFGPGGYALAHLADHKDHGNRFAQEFEVIEGGGGPHPLSGLYTCPSNTVYSPLNLIKPTDFVGTLRDLLVRRAQMLYGEFCKILPPYLRIRENVLPEWDVNEFRWADCVGTTEHIETFLAFRRDVMAKLIGGSDAWPIGG